MALATTTPKGKPDQSKAKPVNQRKKRKPASSKLMKALEREWKKLEREAPPRGTQIKEPGIYENIPFEEYAQIDAINFSSLGLIRQSPAHYRYGKPKDDEGSFYAFGNLVHTAILEPEELFKRYIVMPDITDQCPPKKDGTPYTNVKATAWYKAEKKAFEQANADKIIIDIDDYNKLIKINRGVYKNEDAASLLEGAQRELTLVWNNPETGLLCKARLDAINHDYGVIADLKTTANLQRFSKSFTEYEYHQQQAHYQEGWFILTGETYHPYIFAVEKQEPYMCLTSPTAPEALSLGGKEVSRKLRLIAECRRNKKWPGPSNPTKWTLEPWYQPYDGTY